MPNFNCTMTDRKLSFLVMQVMRRATTRPRLKHTAKPLGIFTPSISSEILTIAACTHVDVDGVNSYSCDCDPGFQETEVDGEKVCGNIDDCGGAGCGGYGTRVDLIDGYWCQCVSGYEQITEGHESICAAKFCGNVSIANSRTPMPLSMSHPESRTIQCGH